jgi:23S rRNA pseudouridine1911/1915/1917 synthase
MPEPVTVRQPGPLLPFLMGAWPGVKRKQALVWLKYKAVSVNDRVVTRFDHPLQAGDHVMIRAKGQAAPGTRVGSHMRIRHEDADIIVIEKPAGLLSMASDRERERSAYFQLTAHVRGGNERSRDRIWIVHRLDRDTSGLMVFAKTETAKRTLQAAWDTAEKRYLAVVEGKPPQSVGTLKLHLDERDPLRVKVAPPGPDSREAITHYRTINAGPHNTLLELTLETGRRHQIRVQLAHAGCPLVGDKKYGAATNPLRRLALHAGQLRFKHPRTGDMMSFDCPLPGEFGGLLKG